MILSNKSQTEKYAIIDTNMTEHVTTDKTVLINFCIIKTLKKIAFFSRVLLFSIIFVILIFVPHIFYAILQLFSHIVHVAFSQEALLQSPVQSNQMQSVVADIFYPL